MTDDEAEQSSISLANLPADVIEILSSHLQLCDLASLNLTCAANRRALVDNDGVWTRHFTFLHNWTTLQDHMVSAQRLATVEPAMHTIHHFQEHIRSLCLPPVPAHDAQPLLMWSGDGAALVPDIAKPRHQCLLLGCDRYIVSCRAILSETGLPHIAAICSDGALRYTLVYVGTAPDGVFHTPGCGTGHPWQAQSKPTPTSRACASVCRLPFQPKHFEPAPNVPGVCATSPPPPVRTPLCVVVPCQTCNTRATGVRLLATGHAESAVRLWGLHPLFPGPSSKAVTTLRGHGAAVVQLLHDADIGLMSAGLDHKVKVWNVDSSRCVSTFKVPRDVEWLCITSCCKRVY